jgi:hypothetical protein
MPKAAFAAWLIMAVAAGIMGPFLLLLLSDEAAASVGRWHLGFGLAGAGLAFWGYRDGPPSGAVVLASAALTMLIAIQAYWIGEFAFLGLTNILLLLAGVGTVLGAIAWFRHR